MKHAHSSERVGKIEKALESSSILYVEMYCDNSFCAVREVTLHLKDYDTNALKAFRSERGQVCPLCRNNMKFHWVRTALEQETVSEQDARVSVNLQMFVRDLKVAKPDSAIVVCASQYTDDRLPPTPDGWFPDGPTPSSRRFLRRGDE